MKKYLLVLLCICNIYIIRAQMPEELAESCGVEDCCFHEMIQQATAMSSFSPINISDRRFDHLFIPASNYTLHFIQVNFIFVQRNDGTGNFQENDPEHQAFLTDLEERANETIARMITVNSPSCYTGTTFVRDARIRFVFDHHYIRDEVAWDNDGEWLCPREYNWYLNDLDNQVVNNPNIKKGINVYFTVDKDLYVDLIINRNFDAWEKYKGRNSKCSEFPDFSNYERSSRIHSPDHFLKYWWMKNVYSENPSHSPWSVSRGWMVEEGGTIMTHELGHSLWLFHESPYYGTNTCYNTIMNQLGNHPRNFLPPSEVGRMYASLSLSNVRNFISYINRPGNFHNMRPLSLSITDTWNFEVRMFQDMKVTSGGNLTLGWKLEVPPQANIIIENGGKLTFDGCQYNSFLTNSTGGVTVQSGGTLVVKNGASLDKRAGFSIEKGAVFEFIEGEIY